MAESGLGLGSLYTSTRWVDTVTETVHGWVGHTSAAARRRNLWVSASAVIYVSRSGLGANSQSDAGGGPSSWHLEK